MNQSAPIGILMLSSQFPRIAGDMGNPETWGFPVKWRTVEGASPERVVKQNADGLLDAFIAAGRELIDEGVCGITTSCGFLALHQKTLSEALDVPVATSSLMQVAAANATLYPNKRAGILTIDEAALTKAHLDAAGVPDGTPIAGIPAESSFAKSILHDSVELDMTLARRDCIIAAVQLQNKLPNVGAIVLECTNMTPYAYDIWQATGLPVYTMISFVTWFRSGLLPPVYGSSIEGKTVLSLT